MGERIIKGFVQNAEMKEEDENNNDKIRRALISFLSPVSCLPGPEKEEHSEHIRMSYTNLSIPCVDLASIFPGCLCSRAGPQRINGKTNSDTST